MSAPCEKCEGSGGIPCPEADEGQICGEGHECHACQVVVSKEFVRAADALANAGGVPESEWKKLHAAYRAARGKP